MDTRAAPPHTAKRFLCPNHGHHIKRKPAILSTEQCTICRWDRRPWTLGDFSVELRNIAEVLSEAQKNPSWDPHGITFGDAIEGFIENWLKAIHKDYRRNLLKRLAILNEEGLD